MSQTHNLPVQDAKYMILDLFPATVEVDGEPMGDANKVVVTDNRLYVIKDAPYGPYIHFEDGASYETFDRPSLLEYTVDTTGGHHVSIKRTKHCACGSRLRGVYPFIGVPYRKQKPVSR